MIFPGGACGAIGTVKINAHCNTNCAGYHYEFKNITWINSNKKMIAEWENQVRAYKSVLDIHQHNSNMIANIFLSETKST